MKKFTCFLFLTLCLQFFSYAQPNKEYSFYEYVQLRDSMVHLNDLDSYKEHLDFFKKYCIYNHSLYGLVAMAYSELNKNKEAVTAIKSLVLEGGTPNDYVLKRLNPEVKNEAATKMKEWQTIFLNNMENENLRRQLAEIHEQDQQLRLKISSINDDSKTKAMWLIQKERDSMNYLRLNSIADQVIENFYDMTPIYDNEALLNAMLDIYLGHYSQSALLKYKDKIYKAAAAGKCSWDLASGITDQLLFKFPIEKQGNVYTHYLYDLVVSNDTLDIIGSYLIIYNLADLLKNNPQANANLITFESNPKNIKILNQIGAFLVGRGISADRVKVILQPYHLSAENYDPKSIFGWQYVQN